MYIYISIDIDISTTSPSEIGVLCTNLSIQDGINPHGNPHGNRWLSDQHNHLLGSSPAECRAFRLCPAHGTLFLPTESGGSTHAALSGNQIAFGCPELRISMG